MVLTVRSSKLLKQIINDRKLWKPVTLLMGIIPLTLILFYWCHTSNSIALTSFTYLVLFNIGNILTYMISIWTSRQPPNNKYTYGYERANVLAIFTITVLTILGNIALLKHSLERVFEPPVVIVNNFFFAICIGLMVHLLVQCLIDNRPLQHAAEVSTPNWLQNALGDLGQSVCGFSPPLGRLLLHRINPFSLMCYGCSLAVFVAKILIEWDDLHLADIAAALFISALMCGTMVPLTLYTGKILLQTTPEHILPLLDKSLREASTLDGVLELKNEHFWTIAFGSYAGSLQVRVRRDADEQEVLSKVTSCLTSQLDDLTIQVVKDDWNVPLATLARPTPSMSPVGGVRQTSPLPSVPMAPLTKLPETIYHAHHHT